MEPVLGELGDRGIEDVLAAGGRVAALTAAGLEGCGYTLLIGRSIRPVKRGGTR
jgi:hypothetical protein